MRKKMRNDSREEILYNIKTRLGRSSSKNQDIADVTEYPKDAALHTEQIYAKDEFTRNALVEQYIAEATKVNTKVSQARSEEEVKTFLIKLAEEKEAKLFSIWENDYFKKIGLKKLLREKSLKTVTAKSKNRMAKADIGITGADFVIADTGTLVLLTDGKKPRSVSLLPPVHIAIVKRDCFVFDIGKLFAILKRSLDADQEITSCMTFITGPSRTADIELSLTLGVHGPKELYVLIVP